jgi:predicted transcriptional regulator of viral defense system
VEYAERLGNRAVFKRLGYMVEALGREEPELISACRTHLSTGLALLDPDGAPDGPRVSAWNIRANARIDPGSPS